MTRVCEGKLCTYACAGMRNVRKFRFSPPTRASANVHEKYKAAAGRSASWPLLVPDLHNTTQMCVTRKSYSSAAQRNRGGEALRMRTLRTRLVDFWGVQRVQCTIIATLGEKQSRLGVSTPDGRSKHIFRSGSHQMFDL